MGTDDETDHRTDDAAPGAEPAAAPARDPAEDLRAIAYELERTRAETYRVQAFRNAATALAGRGREELAGLAAGGGLTSLPGVGKVTAGVIAESLAGEEPGYLARLLRERPGPPAGAAGELRAALRGDCHSHTVWSDGGSPIEEMALAAVRLGHRYLAITDHSPRLKVAKGLSPGRLRRQIDTIDAVNAQLGDGFRLLRGIEADILADGSLDQEPELLDRLDLVVASVHSDLRSPPEVMTERMLAAVRNPRVNILGHCTGRIVAGGGARAGGKTRPESAFDAGAVFAACAEHGVAIEINSRPERLDPPMRLLRRALEAGCLFAIDTDAHAPGQLAWQDAGCERAAECGVPAERIVNTWDADRLTAWARP